MAGCGLYAGAAGAVLGRRWCLVWEDARRVDSMGVHGVGRDGVWPMKQQGMHRPHPGAVTT